MRDQSLSVLSFDGALVNGKIMANEKLPKESESQKLGRFALNAFHNSYPLDTWRPTETDGDTDAGLDMQIQLLKDGHYSHVFNAQIKGSAQEKNGKSAKLSADGEFYSQSLEIKTMNYYAKIENPVMLIFADLTQNRDPRKCKVYYLWIDEIIENLREGKPDLDHLEKDSHTFKIPVENVLNPDQNVLPYLNERIEKRRALDGLYRIVEDKFSDPIEKVGSIGTVFETKDIALDTVLNETEAPWLDAPKDSLAYSLKKSSESLSLNNVELTQIELQKVEPRLSEATDHELSEYYYQKGYLAQLEGNREGSIEFHKKAHEQSPDIKKYNVSYLESKLPWDKDSVDVINKLIDEIPDQNDLEYLTLKSKLLVLIGKPNEAISVLEDQDDKELVVIIPLIHYLAGDYQKSIDEIDNSFRNHEINLRQTFSLRSMKSRALFNLGFENLPSTETIPFAGTPDMKPEILKLSWLEQLEVWEIGEKLGYPANIELAIDVFSILGMYFSEPGIVLKHLTKLSEIRPNIISIQECLLQVALHLDNREIAEKQFEKVPRKLANILNQIVFATKKDNKKSVVSLCNEIFEELIDKKPSNYEMVLAIAATDANELLMYEERDKFLSALKSLPDAIAMLAVYDYVVEVNRDPIKRPEAIEKLYEVYKSGHKHHQLLVQLFDGLDPYKTEPSKKIIEIADDILSVRGLLDKELAILCKAKATLGDWEGVLVSARTGQVQFSNNTRFIVFEALALDEIGETGESIKLLEQIVSGNSYDPTAFEIYINIAGRCGLIEKAGSLIIELFEKAPKREHKINLLRMMFSVEMYINPRSPKLLDICLRYGDLCKQDDETEEGRFLNQFFMATLDPEIKVDEKDVEAFQARLKKFTTDYPDSDLLRSIKINKDDPGDILYQIEKATGLTEDKKRWYAKNENLIKRSNYPVPYIVRPKVLLNVSNYLQLWELSKIIGRENRQYTLIINQGNYPLRETESILHRIPIMDEIALLVLFDLGLLDLVIDFFPEVVIVKESIYSLQNLAQDSAFALNAEKPKGIIQILSKHVSKIKQPTGGNKLESDNSFNTLESIKNLFDPRHYVFYSDDAISRIYVCEDDECHNSMTTIDIINILKERKILEVRSAAQLSAKLCKFNILGLPIRFLDMLIVLNGDLPGEESIETNYERLKAHEDFNSFFKSLWRIDGPYEKAINDIGSFISYMLLAENIEKIENNIVAAIWFFWFEKVQFITKSERDRLHFLARAFVSTASHLYGVLMNDPNFDIVWQRLWSIYDDVVKFTFGREMNRDIENESKILIGEMVASLAESTGLNIFGAVANGLTKGTAEYELFQHSYTENSVEINRNKNK